MADAAIVQTDSGPVRGTVTGEYRLFQGIPYAASTAGDHRWRPPAPVRAWTEPRDATKPGHICAQQPSVYADVASLEEDCLFLNVTTPQWTGADRLKTGDGVDPRRWCHRCWQLLRCSPARGYRRRHRGDDQLPARGLRGVRLRRTRWLWDLRATGSADGIAVGSAQRRSIRGRPGERNAVRRVLRRTGDERAFDLSRIAGSVPPSHHSKRLRLDGPAGGRTVSRCARC
jgi:hypothetical protein